MSNARQILLHKSLVTVFVYLPVGLGHLRVTEALYHGLQEGSYAILLGAQERSSGFLYRLLSINPFLRRLMEIFQRGLPEDIFTYFYRSYLRSKGKQLYQQLQIILQEQIELPTTILMIAPHYAHAYQLAAIKKKFAQDNGVSVVIVVQVSDDAPLDLWYVEGADLIFVPSHKTARALHDYGKKSHLKPVNFIVNPYPISPRLSQPISRDLFQMKTQQVHDTGRSHIHMAIPVSGAAVGTQFYTTLIDTLYSTSDRFIFHVVAKSAPYTQKFLRQMIERPRIRLTVSTHDRGTVEEYERLYENELISLEVTKPSEQSFKALLSPRQRGGSILLLAQPIGRQEYDNLDFLRRHKLIPHPGVRNYLWHKALGNKMFTTDADTKILESASHWRGIELPKNPVEAANFIRWGLKSELFLNMMHYNLPKLKNAEDAQELSSFGVKLFWDKVCQYLQENNAG